MLAAGLGSDLMNSLMVAEFDCDSVNSAAVGSLASDVASSAATGLSFGRSTFSTSRRRDDRREDGCGVVGLWTHLPLRVLRREVRDATARDPIRGGV